MQNEGVKQPTGLGKIILAASAGTLIEWYDFYIFGSLATILAAKFFPTGNTTAGYLNTLATFGAGFVVRPFGAVIFGRMGDLIGRKHTFLLTLFMMAISTMAIGLIPGYAQIGTLAPILLVLLRLTQGLALGGQYGGAATYIAEHTPPGTRGYYTSYLQTTATLGFFVSLLVILATQSLLGDGFAEWGWRIPFLLSAVLVIFSYMIRRRMEESPAFAALKAEGGVSKNPLKEAFGNWANCRLVLIALFGLTAGQGVVWYTGQFYALSFLTATLNINLGESYKIVAVALLLATPFFVVFGRLSDRIGRKKLILAGLALAAITYVPIYYEMQSIGAFNELTSPGPAFHTDRTVNTSTGKEVVTRVGLTTDDEGRVKKTVLKLDPKDGKSPLKGEKNKAEVTLPKRLAAEMSLLVFIQVFFVTLVYGPIAASLVEMFPTRIRYTAMSVPYHIGNGVFGGLVPLLANLIVAKTGNSLAGVMYPISIAIVTLLIGMIFIHEKRTEDGFAEEA
ncbi:MAG TPA: MFS transporter [Fimbriimonadaceae bacterium]|nr:MFS transporter [Fimbriimonadaceae bacterium]